MVTKQFTFKSNIEYIQNIKLEAANCMLEFNWGGEVKNSSSLKYELGVLKIFESFEFTKEFEISENGQNPY